MVQDGTDGITRFKTHKVFACHGWLYFFVPLSTAIPVAAKQSFSNTLVIVFLTHVCSVTSFASLRIVCQCQTSEIPRHVFYEPHITVPQSHTQIAQGRPTEVQETSCPGHPIDLMGIPWDVHGTSKGPPWS